MRKLAAQGAGELIFDYDSLPDELNDVFFVELTEGVERSGDSCLGGEIAPHGVQRDARQRYASLGATRSSPS